MRNGVRTGPGIQTSHGKFQGQKIGTENRCTFTGKGWHFTHPSLPSMHQLDKCVLLNGPFPILRNRP